MEEVRNYRKRLNAIAERSRKRRTRNEGEQKNTQRMNNPDVERNFDFDGGRRRPFHNSRHEVRNAEYNKQHRRNASRYHEDNSTMDYRYVNDPRQHQYGRNEVYPNENHQNLQNQDQNEIRGRYSYERNKWENYANNSRRSTYEHGHDEYRGGKRKRSSSPRCDQKSGRSYDNPRLETACPRNKRQKTTHSLGYRKLEGLSKIQDSDELVVEVLKILGPFEELCNAATNALQKDWIEHILYIFCLCGKSTLELNKTNIFKILSRTEYLYKAGKHLLTLKKDFWQEGKRAKIGECLLSIAENYMKLFEDKVVDIPLDFIQLFVSGEEENSTENEATIIKINELISCRNKLIREQNTVTTSIEPTKYKELTVLPTSSDIHSNMHSGIQPIPISGRFASGEDYLNINFRLLREDLISPLRDGIKEIRKNLMRTKKKFSLGTYTGVRVVELNYANIGVTHKIQFDIDNLKNVNWDHSKRLMPQNLLCFSKDCFETMVFGVVARRKAEELKEGRLEVRFINVGECEVYFKNTSTLMMVESSVYYEAYKHVLNGLTEMDHKQIPFQKYIVQGQSFSCVPKYLLCENPPLYDLNRPLDTEKDKIEILLDKDWPMAEETGFNESQLSAFRAALTNEFVVIQGPPGTGKTYVGVRIADAMLWNNKYWNGKSHDRSPMLVVCYTNHALDQFLEGLLNLGYKDVIRVGGKVSDKLRSYSLFETRRRWQYNHSDSKQTNYAAAFGSIKYRQKLFQENQVESGTHNAWDTDNEDLDGDHVNEGQYYKDATNHIISQRIQQAKLLAAESTKEQFHNRVINGQFIPSYKYDRIMKLDQFQMFQDIYQDCEKLEISIFDVFLEIGNITYKDLKSPFENNAKEEPISTDINLATFWSNSNSCKNETDDNIIPKDVPDMVVSKSNHDANSKVTHDVEIEDGEIDDDDAFESVLKGHKSAQLTNDLRATILMGKLRKQRLEYEQRHGIVNMEMQRVNAMTEEEVELVKDPWTLESQDRWRLYKYWLDQLDKRDVNKFNRKVMEYEKTCEEINEIQEKIDEIVMKQAQIIAMTTTGAAKNRNLLKKVNPKIVIVEEAAEVLEAHVITSLTPTVEHVILIGDHKQLKPKPSVHKLAVEYNLDISLFERMVNNGIELHTLKIQHRMRPEISSFLKHIYPDLIDAESVQNYPNVTGVEKNIFFISHKEKEDDDAVLKSKSNQHEAKFLKSLCQYLLQQGYKPSQITILTGYVGQVILLKKHLPKMLFEGIRISSVDNFQGEENDMVLLSLVRSNEEGRIGFMKNENRVCVCLSRAKIGLYVIGNFDMFVNQQEDTIWKKIIPEAKSKGFCGEKLTLFCHNHPNEKTEVSNEDDFMVVPEGGCLKSCDYRLKCGHSCKRKCHVTDAEHMEYKCQEICEQNNCEYEKHYCLRRCHFDVPCHPCIIKVKKFISSCSHYQQMPCSANPETFKCNERCEKLLSCGHRCNKICSDKCDERSCRERVKKNLPCGHSGIFSCNVDVVDAFCQVKCDEKLLCEHPCFGSCGSCKQGRLHVQCNVKCNRVLMCGHICKDKCTKVCPPCPLKCTNRCTHSECKSSCGNPCTPCKEKCEYRCKHNKCHKRCYEICDREPCNKPCGRKLQCKHKCIGLCAERCPELCKTCNKSEVQEIFFGSEDEPDARFVVLHDCNHMFEVNGLDHWMNSKEDNNIIKLKECPKCKTTIRTTPRYNKCIKQCWEDIEQVKKTILGREVETSKKTQLYKKLQEVDTFYHNIPISDQHPLGRVFPCLWRYHNYEDFKLFLDKLNKKQYFFYREFKNGFDTFVLADLVRASKISICSAENKINLFKQWTNLYKDLVDNSTLKRDSTEWKIVVKDLKFVKKFIMRGAMNDDQQFIDAETELRRLKLFLRVLMATDTLEKIQEVDEENQRRADKLRLAVILEFLKTGEKSSNIDEYTKEIKEMEKRGTFRSQITDEERIMIVKAMGFKKGHWYKCPNGHYYTIGDCGGATQRSKCPECKEVIGGEQHRLATNNQHAGEFDGSDHAAWSDAANMANYDLRE